METIETKYVTEPILTYYDTRIKEYIDEKMGSSDIELERRVDEVEKQSAENLVNIVSHREELDDIEAAILILQEDDKSIHKDIADLRVALENSGGTTEGVTKEYVDEKIEEAISSLQIPDTTNLVTKYELDAAIDEVPTKEDLKQLTEVVTSVEASLEDKADITQLQGLASETYVDNKFGSISVPTKLSELENDTQFLTEAELDNFVTKEYVETTYISNETFSEQVDMRVSEVIQQKVDQGEINVSTDSITYGSWEE